MRDKELPVGKLLEAIRRYDSEVACWQIVAGFHYPETDGFHWAIRNEPIGTPGEVDIDVANTAVQHRYECYSKAAAVDRVKCAGIQKVWEFLSA